MKYIVSTLAAAGLAAAHGYVDNATIGGTSYEFYQVSRYEAPFKLNMPC